MFNKIYVNFKKFIKENYKSLIVFLSLLFLLTYRLPYYIYVVPFSCCRRPLSRGVQPPETCRPWHRG